MLQAVENVARVTDAKTGLVTEQQGRAVWRPVYARNADGRWALQEAGRGAVRPVGWRGGGKTAGRQAAIAVGALLCNGTDLWSGL